MTLTVNLEKILNVGRKALSKAEKKSKDKKKKKQPEVTQTMSQAEKDRIRIAKKKKLKSKMYPPPKTKPSLRRKPMTTEQKNKVLKKMGLKPLRKK